MSTKRPTRADAAGRAYLDLRRLARGDGRATDEYLRLYVLEGFLARLAQSSHVERLVIKGGVLMAAYAVRRPTADVDIAAQGIPGQVAEIRELISAIASGPADDGVVFDLSTATAEPIRDEDQYAGVRVTLTARLASALVRFHVDVNVGDPIWPEPRQIQLPRLLGGVINLLGYPIDMVLAEKIVTAIERGTVNTRWRDFADIYLISNAQVVSGATVARAIREVANRRNVALRRLEDVLDGYPDLAQSKWVAWRSKQMLDKLLPANFESVIAAVVEFSDPLLEPSTGRTDLVWHQGTRVWQRQLARDQDNIVDQLGLPAGVDEVELDARGPTGVAQPAELE